MGIYLGEKIVLIKNLNMGYILQEDALQTVFNL
jgi:hypothetical protein